MKVDFEFKCKTLNLNAKLDNAMSQLINTTSRDYSIPHTILDEWTCLTSLFLYIKFSGI